MKCETMNGKSNVSLFKYGKNECILVIADGAAFGSEIDRVMQLIGGKIKWCFICRSHLSADIKGKSSKAKWADQGCWKSREYVESKDILAGSGFLRQF